ncbi:MAG: substrate-binding domain-containing protein [Anaerolineae bacterium]|nr:substrate-binding domain-containing protein [Anaerolineae bacterium]
MASIQDRGLRIPDDISIVSIDNIELSSMVRPALTTVNVPQEELARHAVQFLITQRDLPERQAASVLLPIELIVRESCGANR